VIIVIDKTVVAIVFWEKVKAGSSLAEALRTQRINKSGLRNEEEKVSYRRAAGSHWFSVLGCQL